MPAVSPNEADAAFAEAVDAAAQGRLEEARDAMQRLRERLEAPAPVLDTQLAIVHLRIARAHSDRGDSNAALASLGEARALAGNEALVWRFVGQLYAEYWRWDDADAALDRAAELEPAHPGTASLQAIVKHERGDDAGALAAVAPAAARDPGDLGLALAGKLYLPQVYADAADLEGWRERYTQGLGALELALPRFLERAADVFELNRTNFLLAYQGRNDLALQRAYSSLLARLVAVEHPQWLEPKAKRFDASRRLRVGFVGNIFRDCTAGKYFERWITGLDPARFERFVYHTAPISDDLTRRIGEASERFVTLRCHASEAIAQVEADALDVLVQPEVGMTPLSYLLAALRVAPVQCVGWGHPVTTGGEGVDHYFTCGAMEPPGAAAHYSERLVELPGLGVGYAMPQPAPAFERAALGLAPGLRLYACPQSLFKIHPEMDALFARLLAADPGGAILFFQATGRAVTERFAARVQRALSAHGIAPGSQLKFLPRMNPQAFRRVLAMADVVIDTVHWSGGNTTLDALAAGTPVVTLPGAFMRGRQSAAMLRMIGLEELVADSREAYVRIAAAVATDGAYNRELRRRIADGRAALFDQPEPVAAFAEALVRLASA